MGIMPVTIQGTVNRLSEELGKLIDINEESSYNEKDEDILEEAMLVINFTVKELSERFHDAKAQRTEVWKTIQA